MAFVRRTDVGASLTIYVRNVAGVGMLVAATVQRLRLGQSGPGSEFCG